MRIWEGTRKYWKADGTFEERSKQSSIESGEYYQIIGSNRWRTRIGETFISIDEDMLPLPIQMAILLLGED